MTEKILRQAIEYRIHYSTPYSMSQRLPDYMTGWSENLKRLDDIVSGEYGNTKLIESRTVTYGEPEVYQVFDHTHEWKADKYRPGLIYCWCGARPVIGVDLVVPE